VPPGWTGEKETAEQNVLGVLHGPPAEGRRPTIVVCRFEAPERTSGAAAARALAEGAASQANSRREELLALRQMSLCGRAAYRLDTRSKHWNLSSYFAVANGQAFGIICAAPRVEGRDYDAAFQYALQGLVFFELRGRA